MPFNEQSILLAIESSCDETSAAVLIGDRLLSNVISSQLFHSQFGGVVPELASRAHLVSMPLVVNQALLEAKVQIQDINGIAVTTNPGLAGALLVGATYAKGLSLRFHLPIAPVNHIEGHIFSSHIENPTLAFPFIALIVSGGHTSLFFVESYTQYRVIGSTKDDAAGEGFDKIAKMLGYQYPGGAKIDLIAQKGNPKAINFPRPLINEPQFDFSFSGLKTSVKNFLAKSEGKYSIEDICASVQEAIADVLTQKAVKAALQFGVQSIVVAGGVSANTRIRSLLKERALKYKIEVFVPSITLCTDNAAMIGFIGRQKLLQNPSYNLEFTVSPVAIRALKL